MAELKAFRDYMKDRETEYNFRIKTVVPLDDEEMEMIERVLTRYMLKDITAPVKTIIQKHPLDFQDIENAEVWIVDIVTSLPISAYVLLQELKLALNIPERFIVVRSDNDPKEIETQRMVANDEIDMEAMEKGLSPAARLSTSSDYDEDEQRPIDENLYGDEYNKTFLDILATVASEREKFIYNPASEELDQGGTVEDVPDTIPEDTFNDDIDTPKPVYSNYAKTLKNMRKAEKSGNPRLSTKGNYDDDEIIKTKKYDKYGTDGKKVSIVTIKNRREGIRKTN